MQWNTVLHNGEEGSERAERLPSWNYNCTILLRFIHQVRNDVKPMQVVCKEKRKEVYHNKHTNERKIQTFLLFPQQYKHGCQDDKKCIMI